MRVAVSRLHFPVTALGPGRRVGLWFQGCAIRCPGCVSVDTWTDGIGETALPGLLDAIDVWIADADGLTVSGGEPFGQPEALAEVLRFWRRRSRGSILVYTGHELDDVAPWLDANPGLVDGLMTGPFRSDLSQTLALRGSDNQRLHVLSPQGREFAPFDRPARQEDRSLDVMFDDEGRAWLAGIPARGDLARLRRVLTAAGHEVQMSDSIRNLA
ncbi:MULTISPECIES: 4Fe-4S single cluster domain-containing protein [Bosea]|jgi:anaerobic ribonucleoside-triphosphate reductase activating protein|uniref:Radical SAM protein n=1 Tax=Bosea vaviloviae TaxID=1526658 RepID=A0A0N1N441_9HYPH|nr:4Fe-4S single cluster domain-containing protein [Bosea vaviloviae]KPH80801.1 radical SAM protein [Bosea vaviloviae]